MTAAPKTPFSALLSLYIKEKPENLAACLDSLKAQTRPADEVVMVLDGPITEALRAEIDRADVPGLKLVPLPENLGLGAALNKGLAACSHELIARADTDDINLPERFARQIAHMEAHPELAIISCHVEEFGHGRATVRRVPVSPEEVAAGIGRRNPLNHPAVVMRKSVIEALGGYPVQRYAQDYQLWINVQAAGHKIANLDESLVRFRVSPEFYSKRGGLKYLGFEYQLQRNLLRKGLVGPFGFALNMLLRGGVRLVPNQVRDLAYRLVRRQA